MISHIHFAEVDEECIQARKAWLGSMETVLERQSAKLTSDQALPHFESRHITKSQLDGIWVELRARWIHCTSIQNELEFLEEKRQGFPGFVRKIDTLTIEDEHLNDLHQYVESLLKDYDRYASYYPSYKKLHEVNGSVVTPHFIARINALQSWVRLKELSNFVLEDLKFLLENNRFQNPKLSLLEQSDEFFLSLIQDAPLRHCYRDFVDRDILMILPKLKSIFDATRRTMEMIGLPIDLEDMAGLATAAPALQTRCLLALTRYAKMTLEHGSPMTSMETIIEAVIDRFQTMISVRSRFFTAGLMEWVPKR
jgi:hypothetical protein